ncbi:MAG: hypothetical protein EG825_14865 [Rhodocyclaceae bacterium]|nr:hypothetical protein [Rhodocyclaceae bacterium]
MEQRKPLPKDELRDDAIGVFFNSDDDASRMDLTSQDVSDAAFKAVFFDVPEIQAATFKHN